MTPEEIAAYALAKPGAWPDQPWEGDHVAKVADKIFLTSKGRFRGVERPVQGC